MSNKMEQSLCGGVGVRTVQQREGYGMKKIHSLQVGFVSQKLLIVAGLFFVFGGSLYILYNTFFRHTDEDACNTKFTTASNTLSDLPSFEPQFSVECMQIALKNLNKNIVPEPRRFDGCFSEVRRRLHMMQQGSGAKGAPVELSAQCQEYVKFQPGLERINQ